MGCDDAPDLSRAIAETLGETVRSLDHLGSGAGGETLAVSLHSGRRVFLKTSSDAPAALFEAEAAGLSWLAQAKAIRLPRVVAVRTDPPYFVALELLEPGPRAPDFDTQLGQQLAALHQTHPRRFGLEHDNYVGPLPQDNAAASEDTFAAFYRERRLLPLVKAQYDRGLLDRATRDRLLSITESLPERVPVEPPARLHGDLWAGNVMRGPRGEPVLIDPSVYGGHREIDLAMMQLFGGVSPVVLAAYNEAYPLAPGWRARVPLMQLYPLLVHVALFGDAYTGRLAAAAAALN